MRKPTLFIPVLILNMIILPVNAQEKHTEERQVPFKTIHIFNLKTKYSIEDAQLILDKFNSLFIQLGHPECYYRLWESSGEEKQPQYLWESFWTSRDVYDDIHKNSEYRKLVRGEMLGLRRMFQDHTYYRYYEHSSEAAKKGNGT